MEQLKYRDEEKHKESLKKTEIGKALATQLNTIRNVLAIIADEEGYETLYEWQRQNHNAEGYVESVLNNYGLEIEEEYDIGWSDVPDRAMVSVHNRSEAPEDVYPYILVDWTEDCMSLMDPRHPHQEKAIYDFSFFDEEVLFSCWNEDEGCWERVDLDA